MFFEAKELLAQGAYSALVLNSVVVYPEFRNAPEAKVPGGATDCYDGIKWIYQNGSSHGIDTSRICLAGQSGGSFLATCAAHMLVKSGD